MYCCMSFVLTYLTSYLLASQVIVVYLKPLLFWKDKGGFCTINAVHLTKQVTIYSRQLGGA